MRISLNSVLAEVTVLRLIAGLIFLPIMALVFQPFQNMELSFSLRLIFWTGVMTLALGVSWVARRLLARWFAHSQFTARELVVVPIVFVLFVPALWLMAWLLFAVEGQTAPDVWSVASYGVLIASGLLLVRRTPAVAVPEDVARVELRLLKRLPTGFSGQILHLMVRDHSVDVVTSEGTYTIRSRLSDAIAEMEPEPGHCTHRSHWVVDAAIAGVEREGSKTFLRLTNNHLVPVSRKYKPMLERDGVI